MITVGDDAFKEFTALASVSFTNSSVTTINATAFLRCNNLTSISFGGSNVITVGDFAFYSCTALASVSFTNSSVTSVGNNAFNGCTALASTSFGGSNVITVGDFAFYSCTALASVSFTNSSVTSVGNNAFRGCTALASTSFGGSNLNTVGESAFRGCTALASVSFTNSNVTAVGTRAFSVGTKAFFGCTALASVSFTNSDVTTINTGAFRDCINLTSVSFANSNVATVGTDAFYGCTNLASVSFTNSSVTTVGTRAFRGCIGLVLVSFGGSNVATVGTAAFARCDALVSVSFRNSSVTTVNSSAFASCSALESVLYDDDDRNQSIAVDSGAFPASGCHNFMPPGACKCVPFTAANRSAPCVLEFGVNPSSGGAQQARMRNYTDAAASSAFNPGVTKTFPGFNLSDVTLADVFQNLRPGLDLNRTDLVAFSVESNYAAGDPNFGNRSGASLGEYLLVSSSTGTVSLKMDNLGNHTVRLIARTGRGPPEWTQPAVVHEWTVQVEQPGAFSLTQGGECGQGYMTELQASITEKLRERTPRNDRHDLDTTVVLPGINTTRCNFSAMFANAATDDKTGEPQISFGVVVEDWDTHTPADLGDAPLYNDAGRVSLNLKKKGRFRAKLQAFTVRPDGRHTLDLTEMTLDVRLPDTYDAATQAKRDCSGNGAVAEDLDTAAHSLPQNDVYNCSCTGSWTGKDCGEIAVQNHPAPSDSIIDGVEDRVLLLSTIIGLVLVAVAIVARGRLATRRAVIHLHALAKGTTATAAGPEAYTAAMFKALDLGVDELVPRLIDRGADPNARHLTTHRHAHSILLSRPFPDCKVLEPLFRSSCVIDAGVGALIVGPQQRAALETVLTALAHDPPQSSTSSTVLHAVVEACLHNHLDQGHAAAFSKRLLTEAPPLLYSVDALGRTAGDVAMQCDDAVELERLLTVVLYDTFQLTTPSEHLYQSPTAVVLDCRMLATAAAPSNWASARRTTGGLPDSSPPSPPLVIKLMTDSSSWYREINMRGALSGDAAASVVQIVSVASSDPEAPGQVGKLQLVRDPGPGSGRGRHAMASTLTAEFPYAIVMDKADRNLLEVIANERLSAEPIGVLRSTAAKVGTCIAKLHACDAVHGDIKPRNVVRTADRAFGTTFMLIDLDMAYVAASSTEADATPSGLPRVHASALKLRETSAYVSPELFRWAQVGGVGDGAPEPITGPASAVKADIWSFGVLLYELVTGTPLLAHAYDTVSSATEARLLAWDGLQNPELAQLRRLHQSEGATALIDVLQWCLDPDPVDRPSSMTDVLAHAFFEPATGSMREHFVVQRIRELLAANPGWFRPAARVMISYSWHNTTFVLDRLCVALAPLVEGMWLDRLGGGDQGMGEWTHASMARGVAGADVIIAVVSPQYMTSKNCGLEMRLAGELGKTIIPIMLGVPFVCWPPAKVGETIMTNQFADPKTGDMKLFVDFSDLDTFETKFNMELRPRIERQLEPTPFGGIIAALQEHDGGCGRPEAPKELRRSDVELLSELGSGKFGTVHKAVMQAPSGVEFLVAVKQLKVDTSDDGAEAVPEPDREAFLKEAAITAQLRHPNVIGLVGVVTAGAPHQMVLQFCEQGGLDGVLRKKDHTSAQLVRFGVGIAAGMAYLAGLFVHRDLASRNVLLDSKGTAKVADFGLSKSLYTATYYAQPQGSQQLPLRWLAPELLTPGLADLQFSERTDVYAFGITLVEVFSKAVLPFGQWGNDMVIDRVQGGYVHARPQACPEAVYDEVIAPCLANDPSRRPSFGDLGPDLQSQYYDLISPGGKALAAALKRAGSRDRPTRAGAWVNYDPGKSEGGGDGGLFYIATGDKKWSHDEVYRQNPALGEAVGTRDEPTCHIFDCVQGTVGIEGKGGEATGERQTRYWLNVTQRDLKATYELLDQKDTAVRLTGGDLVVAASGRPQPASLLRCNLPFQLQLFAHAQLLTAPSPRSPHSNPPFALPPSGLRWGAGRSFPPDPAFGVNDCREGEADQQRAGLGELRPREI